MIATKDGLCVEWLPYKDTLGIVCDRMLKEGFTKEAIGSGTWTRGRRITAMYAFFHPKGIVATFQKAAYEANELTPPGYRAACEIRYTIRQFHKYCKENSITLQEKKDLRVAIAAGEL